jgi:hypothetical protein
MEGMSLKVEIAQRTLIDLGCGEHINIPHTEA